MFSILKSKSKDEKADEFFEQAGSFFSQEKYTQALKCYDEGLKIKPNNAYQLQMCGRTLYNLKRFQEALESYDASLKISPNHPDTLIKRGEALRALGHQQESLQSSLAGYDLLLEKDPNSSSLLSKRAVLTKELIKLQNDNPTRANVPVSKTIIKGSTVTSVPMTPDEIRFWELYHLAFSEGNAAAQCDLAWMYAKGLGVAKNEKKACELYQLAVDQGLARAQYELGTMPKVMTDDEYFDQGEAYYKKREYQNALESFDACLKITPDDPAAIHNRGLALMAMGRYEEAIASYNASLAVDPNNTITINKRADAIAALEKQKKENQNQLSADEYNAQGIAYYSKGLYQKALESFENSLKVRPSDATTLASLGDTLRVMKRNEEALISYDTSLKLRPNHEATLTGRGKTLHALGRFSEALRSYNHSFENKATQGKITSKVQITEDQIKFISALQSSGIQPNMLSQMQKQFSKFLSSSDDSQQYKTWIEEFSARVFKLEAELLNTKEALSLDPKTQSEQSYIDSHPKLKNYLQRLLKELICFITCYFLAPAGLFKLEDNKKESALSLVSGIPIAGQFLKVLTSSLSIANKKYRFYQMNRLNELFKTLDDITKICSSFARQVTLAQENTIEQQNYVKYQGFAKVKGFYHTVKETLDNQWKDLALSDKTGVTLGAEEKMAVLDAAYLLQQILSGDAKVNKNSDLTIQFIEIVTGKPFNPRLSTSTSTVNNSASLVIDAPNKAPVLDVNIEAIQSMVNAHQETLRKQQEEFERHKKEQEERNKKLMLEAEEARRKAIAAEAAAEAYGADLQRQRDELRAASEAIQKLKKNMSNDISLGGGSQALAQLNPNGNREIEQESLQIISKHDEQLRLVCDELVALREGQKSVSHSLYQIQDKTGITRDKVELKRIQQEQHKKQLEQQRNQNIAKKGERSLIWKGQNSRPHTTIY